MFGRFVDTNFVSFSTSLPKKDRLRNIFYLLNEFMDFKEIWYGHYMRNTSQTCGEH
jgi:hypothetical protein